LVLYLQGYLNREETLALLRAFSYDRKREAR
jgi:hypothetical protein